MKARYAFLLMVLGSLAGGIGAEYARRAEASRNSSGTYSLPGTVNPVVTGTTITSTWSNTTLNDIGTELTNSLDRSGRGAMLAPLLGTAGSASFPSFAFSAEPNSGLYRNTTNDIRFAVAGSDVQKWGASGVTITGVLNTNGTLTTGNATSSGDTIVDSTGQNAGTTTYALRFGSSSSGEVITSRRTAGTGAFGLDLWTNSSNKLSVANAAGVQIPGEFATTPGTSISGSYAASPTLSWGSVAGQGTASASTTINGVTTNSTCEVSNTFSAGIVPGCHVSGANTVAVTLNNVSAGSITQNSIQTFIRVWNN